MSKLIDLTGKVFSRLTVVSRATNDKRGNARWHCICECGNGTTVDGGSLTRGKSTSCGKGTCHYSWKHGLTKTRIYQSWKAMIRRCTNKEAEHFKDYGARGITVTERWLSFDNFLADMGDRPDGMTIERIDNDKGYSPENCKWATLTEQANNKRNNKYITHEGERLTYAQWSRRLGGDRTLVGVRIRSGWSEERAVTTRVGA